MFNLETHAGKYVSHRGDTLVPISQSLRMGFGQRSESGVRTFARPMAGVIATPEWVPLEPVFDITKIALALLIMGAFMVSMFLQMIIPRKAIIELQAG